MKQQSLRRLEDVFVRRKELSLSNEEKAESDMKKNPNKSPLAPTKSAGDTASVPAFFRALLER